MQKTRKIFLYITIILWAIIMGGIMYAHIVYMPAYLRHLPDSNQLIRGEFGLHDENFWMFIHPFAIIFTLLTLVLHWRSKQQRRFVLIPAVIYGMVIFITAIYFVPELRVFAAIDANTAPTSQVLQRGQDWEHRSWVRGVFMFFGFIMLQVALEKGETVNKRV